MSKRKEKDGTVPGPPDSSPQIVSAGSEVAGAEGARVVGSEVIGETVGAGEQRVVDGTTVSLLQLDRSLGIGIIPD